MPEIITPGITGKWRPVFRFLIRSAGFPIELTECGAAEVVEALDRVAKPRARAAQLLRQWPERFDAAVDRLEHRPEGAAPADRPLFKAVYRARREVTSLRPVPEAVAGRFDAAWVRDWHACLTLLDSTEQELDDAVRRAAQHGRDALRALLADPRFAAALTVSNPGAAAIMARTMRADPQGRRSATRQAERTVYAYAQRFATKNETVSFFGPVDYGAFDTGDTGAKAAKADNGESGEAATTRLRYAHQPVQARSVRLAHWAVQALADRVAREPALAEHLPVRLRDGCALTPDGDLLIAATDRRVRLGADRAAVLRRAASGRYSCAELRSWSHDPSLVEELLTRGLLTCHPLVPTALDDPGAWLLDQLNDLVRSGATVAEPWRDTVAALVHGATESTGGGEAEPGHVPHLDALETAFTQATGEPARRGAGDHFADRLLVTEDYRGGVTECAVPAGETETLIRRLSPALLLCASYSTVVQRAVHERALALHAELARGGPVSYLRLVAELDAALPIADAQAAPGPTAWLDRLDALIDSHTTDGTAHLDPAALAPLLTEPPPGLVVSPDIFLCADPARTSMADNPLVIGEVHHGAQVWSQLSVLDPEPSATETSVAVVTSGTSSTSSTGAGPEIASLVCRRTQGKAFERELPGPAVRFRAALAQPHSRVWDAAQLTVHESGGVLRLAAPDGTPVRLRARHPRAPANWLFGPPPVIAPLPLRDAAYAPRVLVGDVVAWRRRWRLDADRTRELAAVRDPAPLVRAAAGMRDRLGLPRRVFAKSPAARKPVFADLHCPTSLLHLSHYLRKSPTVDLTEMLPEPGQWWLRPAGRLVSCEWRLTVGWEPSSPASDPTVPDSAVPDVEHHV